MVYEIKVNRRVNVDDLSKLVHVLGYNYGEVSKAVLWALKYKNNLPKRDAYLVHLATNLSDLLTDIHKIREMLGIPKDNFDWLADEREKERRETFRKKGRPYI